MREISIRTTRRLAITKQRLAGRRPAPDADGIMEVARDLGCLQLDPISAVERTHLLVLWSRLGAFDRGELDRVVYEERRMFEYWAHCASLVLTDEYPVHNLEMRKYGMGAWRLRAQTWMEENAGLRDELLGAMRERGPIMSKEIEDKARVGWESSGWTGGRNVSRMLDHLWISGQIMVAGRRGGQKMWDLAERVLPEWTPREEWSEKEVVLFAAQKSLRALGVATMREIGMHYIRGRYPGLRGALAELEREGKVERVSVVGDDGAEMRGPYYVHTDCLGLLEEIEKGEWEGRTVLLSPFDNLICDRRRTEELFGFRFRIEIYVPQAKREYGYYVLPILHGDRLIGRIDPLMDRKSGVLNVNAVYKEVDAPPGIETGRAVGATIGELAAFLGAREVAYGEGVKDVLRYSP